MKITKSRGLMAALFSLVLSLAIVFPGKISATEAPLEVYANLAEVLIEGGVSAPMTVAPAIFSINSEVYAGLDVTLSRGTGYNQLRIPITEPVSIYKIIAFKARFPDPMPSGFTVSVSYHDKTGGWMMTNYATRITSIDSSGWVEFEWDVVNSPGTDFGADLDDPKWIAVKFSFPLIPVSETRTFEIADVRLIKESEPEPEPAINVVYPDLDDMVVEGGVSSPLSAVLDSFIIGDEVCDGATLTLEHRESYVALRIPLIYAPSTYNTIAFKMRFPEPMPPNFDFQVHYIDTLGKWHMTGVRKHSAAFDGEWIEFKWDIINQPDVNMGADLNLPARLHLKFTFNMIPVGETRDIEIADLRLISGESAESGDPALFALWKSYVNAYTPNYSDSSTHLLPPTTGRISPGIAIVEDHLPLAEIVTGPISSPVIPKAAEELQLWVKKLTGATLPILTSATPASNKKIFLGSYFALTNYSADLDTLDGTDGFAMRTEGDSIYLFGATPKGTLNGVFAFLENNTDIIWARPQPDYGTIYSEQEDLNIVWANAIDIPTARIRGWLPNVGHGDSFNLWSDRNRNNYTPGDNARNLAWGNLIEFGGGHNLQSFIPPGNPLYYPTIGGVKPATLSIWEHQICMSVPGLVNTYATNVLNYISASGPAGMSTMNIKIEDNHGVCECDDCVAPIDLGGGKTITVSDPAFRSTQFFRFLNAVTEQINLVYPNLRIQTYAYFFTAIPPKVEVNPSIDVLFCPYVRKDHRTPLFSPVNDSWWKIQSGWAEATENVIVREYYGIFNEGRPLAEVVAADVAVKIDMGITAFSSEINRDQMDLWWDGVVRGAGDEYDLNMMDYWVITRLYWNPDADVEQLRKYFLRRTFREAAPAMERIFGMIRESWYKEIASSTWGNGNAIMNYAFGNSARLASLNTYIAQARAAVVHPQSRVLVNRVAQRIENYLANTGVPPAPETVGGQLRTTPEVAFEYGWPAPAYRTELPNGNTNKKALRIAFNPGTGGSFASIASRPIVVNLTDRGFTFRIKGDGLPTWLDASTLPAMTISSTPSGKVERSPSSAYTQTPEGDWVFHWVPTGNNGTAAVDLSSINRMNFVYPGSGAVPAESISLLLEEPTVTENP